MEHAGCTVFCSNIQWIMFEPQKLITKRSIINFLNETDAVNEHLKLPLLLPCPVRLAIAPCYNVYYYYFSYAYLCLL